MFISQMNGTTYLPCLQTFQERMSLLFTQTPVQLQSFTAMEHPNGVRLAWRTATQTNNYGWEIERENGSDSWKKVGFVPGHGTTQEQRAYEFIDQHVECGMNYGYRLKQIDIDGTTEYSPVARAFTFATPTTYAVGQNFPNPFSIGSSNGPTTILYSLPVPERVTIEVKDFLGRKIKTLIDDARIAGQWEVSWDGRDEAGASVAQGVYFYTVSTPNFRATKRMVVMK